MVKQQSVHLKMDLKTYAWIQQYVFRTGINRNRLINIACEQFVKIAQAKARADMAGKFDLFAEAANMLGILSKDSIWYDERMQL